MNEIPASRHFRTTELGLACVELAGLGAEPLQAMPAHAHDILVMCRNGLALAQLRQFMPPRTLQEKLNALVDSGLLDVDRIDP